MVDVPFVNESGRELTQRHGWWWCAAAAILFGAATPATKMLVDDAGALTIAGLLYLGAAAAVAPFAVREERSPRTRRERSLLLVSVGLGGGLAPVLLVLALDRTAAGTVSLFLNLELVATAIIARVFLHEHVGRRAAIGIVVVVVGGVILVGTSELSVAAGALLVVGACVCWGVDNAITAGLDAYSPSQITLAKGVVAGSVNLALGVALDGAPGLGSVAGALAIGAVGYGMSITMWITGARLLGAARGQAIFALAPFIGVLLARPINGDQVTPNMVVAFAVSLVGVLVVATSHHRHRHAHQLVEHSHPIDPTDPHHQPGTIVVVSGAAHRHLPLTHEHEHLPDIHHRHEH